MFVRGPGITGGTRAPNVGGNVDLAPTFLDLAGVAIPPQVDGNLIYQ
jgi:arylsulfatase A-like enzyme